MRWQSLLLALALTLLPAGSRTAPPGQQLPIARRSFLLGVTPTADRSRDVGAALQLARSCAEVVMHWVTPNGAGLLEAMDRRPAPGLPAPFDAIRSVGLEPVANLNPWTVAPGKGIVRNDGSGSADFGDPGFRRRMCQEAATVARRFRPRYFCIGNEVNSLYEMLGAEAFDRFMDVEHAIYRAVKHASPETRVLIVVSWSQLVDLPGGPRLHLLPRLEGACDIIGVTSYPWRRYETPADLPPKYYLRLRERTRHPVAFTEIGWSSDTTQGGSEQEQVEFLERFLELTRTLQPEFVNWAFLHDLPSSSVDGMVVQRSHLGLGLRRYDGSPKPVWRAFEALCRLPGPASSAERRAP